MTKRHSRHEPSPGDVSVRSDGDAAGGDEMYSIRLPISSTAVARDGDAFSADRLRGFADQIEGRTVPVFLSHGRSGLSAERYGALGKVGRVANPALEERDGVTTLDADLLIADPDSLAESGDTGDVEAALRWVREQAKRGLVATSVGWNEDVGGRDVAGDAELLEVSIVGIASDTEAVQRSAEPSDAVERGLNGLPSPSTSRASSRTGFDALARKARDDPPTAVREHPTDDRTSHPEVETEERAGALVDGAQEHLATLRDLADQLEGDHENLSPRHPRRSPDRRPFPHQQLRSAVDTLADYIDAEPDSHERHRLVETLSTGDRSYHLALRDELATAVDELREAVPTRRQRRPPELNPQHPDYPRKTNAVRQALEFLETLADGRDPTRLEQPPMGWA
jgi:hypothetical protein